MLIDTVGNNIKLTELFHEGYGKHSNEGVAAKCGKFRTVGTTQITWRGSHFTGTGDKVRMSLEGGCQGH